MAARVVWQRTANRCFIGEDAKRASKLACCSSISSVLSEIDTKCRNPTDENVGFERSFDSNRSTGSKWWVQMQPDCISHSSSINLSKGCYEFVEMDSVEHPWLQMAEKDNLGQFLSKKSQILIEKPDLDRTMNTGFDPQNMKCNRTAVSGGELQGVTSKTKILEALCHSQTRARKAELAATKAIAEKDHVIKILFKQGLQLFAYKQWIYRLQLENLCYQIKNSKSSKNIDPILSSKPGISSKNLKKMGKRARIENRLGRYERGLGGFAVVFVVGLGIVGAGFVLGWTIGWMLL